MCHVNIEQQPELGGCSIFNEDSSKDAASNSLRPPRNLRALRVTSAPSALECGTFCRNDACREIRSSATTHCNPGNPRNLTQRVAERSPRTQRISTWGRVEQQPCTRGSPTLTRKELGLRRIPPRPPRNLRVLRVKNAGLCAETMSFVNLRLNKPPTLLPEDPRRWEMGKLARNPEWNSTRSSFPFPHFPFPFSTTLAPHEPAATGTCYRLPC